MSQSAVSTWYYVRNPFDNVTKNSYKRMVLLSRDTHDKLLQRSSDPDILPLYNTYLPKYQAFNQTYTQLQSNWGMYQAATLRTENLFLELSRKSKRWEAMVMVQYDDRSAEYLSLFPNNKIPFQSGAYDMRLEALSTLELSLGNYADLSAVLAEVTLFRADIEAARTKQQGYEQNDSQLRLDLEHQRADLAIALQRLLGGLLYLYAHDPAQIETFFELQYLQSPAPKQDPDKPTRTVQANSRSTASSEPLNEGTLVELENVGNVPLGFFVSNDENAATPAVVSTLPPGEAQTYTLEELSDGTPNPRYLMVVNTQNEQGRYKASVETPQLE